jgi:D-cysteine desulfhydrase
MPLSLNHIPARIDLARTPTPLQPLRRWSEKLGVNLMIKRDDLTGAALSGNKIRKLEFALADAKSKKADTILTCGGEQSNHCRATAIAAAMLGLNCRLLLRTADPSNPPPPEGNILLDRMAGAEIIWITPEEYKRRDELFTREADALRNQGKVPYIIPEGASYPVGAWGYISAMDELVSDISEITTDDEPVTIIHACGSGGTAAGLILGAKLTGVPIRIASVNVCDDRNISPMLSEVSVRKRLPIITLVSLLTAAQISTLSTVTLDVGTRYRSLRSLRLFVKWRESKEFSSILYIAERLFSAWCRN